MIGVDAARSSFQEWEEPGQRDVLCGDGVVGEDTELRGCTEDAYGPFFPSSQEPAGWQPWVCRRGYRPRGRGAKLEPGCGARVKGYRGAFAWGGEMCGEGAGGTECGSVCLRGQAMKGLIPWASKTQDPRSQERPEQVLCKHR